MNAASVAAVAAVVRGYRFTYATEAQLQDGIAQALEIGGYTVAREVTIDAGRLDLLVDDWIGVEVKIAGGPSEVAAQVGRYLASDAIGGLVLVTGRVAHLALEHPRLAVVTLAAGGL